jgi:hypothetical protein
VGLKFPRGPADSFCEGTSLFHATNFSVTVLLLLAFTVFIMGVRQRRPVENNWPFLYWILVMFFTLVRPEETYHPNIVLFGLCCGMLLRFEFMNTWITKGVRVLEMCVFAYVLVRGVNIIFY